MRTLLAGLVVFASQCFAVAATPNVVLIFADDLGYADLGCFGATQWKTPNLDRIAKEGVRFTNFYVAQPVCSASRTSLLTGCYANRLGLHGALGPNAKHGINGNETTLAEVLKSKGYATGMVGKWHLGHHPQFLPTRHGFDSYLGLPYSNDMWPHHPEAKPGSYPKLPLIDGDRIIDSDVTADDQAVLTAKYRDRAVQFIREQHAKPFFLYFAHTFPHVPLFVGEQFRGSSGEGGTYGDVIQEFDSAVGDILRTLKETGVEDNTLVVFTSDNGPWLSYGNHAGRKGPLREGKGSVWEGGVRVPFVAKWPGHIPAGAVQHQPAMTIDLLPTIAKFVNAELPKLPIDGKPIDELLTAKPNAKSPQEAYFYYYAQNQLQAVRSGKWKLILPHTARMIEDRLPGRDGKPAGYQQVKLEQMLFDLEADVGEQTDVAAQHPDVVKRLLQYVEKARADMGDALTNRKGSGTREPGRLPDQAKKPTIRTELVFPLNAQHNHAPGIVECATGDLLVSWYRGSGERSADDVKVLGSRLKKGDTTWSDASVWADTPGFPDCNTTMWIDAKERLWLFWPVIIANSWESCITQYRVSSSYATGVPTWDWQGNILLKPLDFEATMIREFAAWKASLPVPVPPKLGDDIVKQRVNDKLLSRLGWQPRCKPTVLKSGRILLPLYSDTYSAGIMAISDDGGATWSASQPLAGFGSIQPSVLERADGSLIAYMRENGVYKKIRTSESRDGGKTWGRVISIELPNPGSGVDAVKLANGHFVLIYNDTIKGRNSLAVSISDDDGHTWKWTRHLEQHATGSYHYPAIIQGRDGTIHAVYSYFVEGGKSMKHAAFDEAWVTAGDS
jgi:arylsulfatase A